MFCYIVLLYVTNLMATHWNSMATHWSKNSIVLRHINYNFAVEINNIHAMMKVLRKMKHSWQRMIYGMPDTFSPKKTYSDKDVINLILFCSEEKAKALLKEGPDSMEAKSMSTYIDTLYDLLIRRK